LEKAYHSVENDIPSSQLPLISEEVIIRRKRGRRPRTISTWIEDRGNGK